jgi:pyruvate dehydrogenase E2 component (dihydrolipoamide acetyltransferase)
MPSASKTESNQRIAMTHTVIMPDLGQTTSEGKILRWLKSPGDKVTKGEALLEVETDKATVEVEAFATGYLRAVMAQEGEMAAALAPIAILTDSPDEPFERPGAKASAAAVPTAAAPPAPAGSAPAPKGGAVAPAARALAKELGLDVSKVPGTGAGGLVTRADVERYAASQGAAPAEALTGMAALVTKSKQTIPHFYVTVEADVAAAEKWRKSWNAAHPDLTASMNDVFVRAAAKALADVPRLNVTYRGGKAEARAAADVLLVVAVESGLTLVPIAAPDRLAWEDFLQAMKSALEKARQGRVAEASAAGAPALALSNLGMFGVKEFAAIIPPACAAILAIGAVRSQPVVSGDEIRIGRVCSLTLSVDHRVADGIVAAQFLERVQAHLNSL